MASVIHIAEVAAILTVAYGLGWVIGYLVHRLVARAPAPATIPAERVNAVADRVTEAALVKAPVIEPVPNSPPPAAPVSLAAVEPPPAAVEPVPAEMSMAAAEPVVVVPPAPVESAPVLPPVAIPVVSVPPMQIEPLPPRARPPVDPEPPSPPEPEVILTSAPASRPGEAWSGEVRGRTAVSVASPEPVPVAPDVVEPPPTELPLTIDLGELGPDSIHGEPVVPPPAPPQPAAKPLDEDAAMRAIEGGWSRVKTRAMSDAPELSDVGAAVAAAQSAVEQVLAKAGIDAETSRQSARPKGLPRARNGRKDDLKQINGLGALDESTLNNLGVFHFDQIAGWSEAQVLWMENHVFARGRIGQENWQQQARDLAAAVSG